MARMVIIFIILSLLSSILHAQSTHELVENDVAIDISSSGSSNSNNISEHDRCRLIDHVNCARTNCHDHDTALSSSSNVYHDTQSEQHVELLTKTQKRQFFIHYNPLPLINLAVWTESNFLTLPEQVSHVSLAERLQPVLLTDKFCRPIDLDSAWSHTDTSEKALQLAAGPQVNLEQCQRDLVTIEQRIEANGGDEQLHLTHDHELIAYLDTFGRPQTLSATGNRFWFGAYQQCRRTTLTKTATTTTTTQTMDKQEQPTSDEKQSIEMRYCWTRMRYPAWSENAPAGAIYANWSYMNLGVCVPDTCDTRAFMASDAASRASLKRLVSRYMIAPYKNLLEMDTVYCLPDEQSALRQWPIQAYVFAAFLLVWLSLCFYYTCCVDGDDDQQQLNQRMARAFNVLQHFKGLFKHRQAAPKSTTMTTKSDDDQHLKNIAGAVGVADEVNFDATALVRVIGAASVVWGHCLMIEATFASSAAELGMSIRRDMGFLITVSIMQVVDSFFVLSGLMFGYMAPLKLNAAADAAANKQGSTLNDGSPRSALKVAASLVAHRYLRLMPVYFIVYIYVRYVAPYTGHGPAWDYATQSESFVGACTRESWWVPLLLLANFVPMSKQCMPVMWSVACDLHSSLVSSPIAYYASLVRHKPHYRRYIIATLCCFIVASLACFKTSFQRLSFMPVEYMIGFEPYGITLGFRFEPGTYTSPQNRASSILVGLLAGLCLYWWRQDNDNNNTHTNKTHRISIVVSDNNNNIKLSTIATETRWWQNQSIWYMSWITLVATFMYPSFAANLTHYELSSTGATPIIYHGPVTQNNLLLGVVCARLLWASASAFILFRLVTDLRHDAVGRFMSAHVFQIGAKLSYGVLLLHVPVGTYLTMMRTSFVEAQWLTVTSLFLTMYILTTVGAAILYTIFEMPLTVLLSPVRKKQLPATTDILLSSSPSQQQHTITTQTVHLKSN